MSNNNLVDYIAERTVIAGLCYYGSSLYYEIDSLLDEETFTDKTNKALYHCIKTCFDDKHLEKVDQSSIIITLNELGYGWITSNRNEIDYLVGIINTKVERANILKWALKIRKLQVTRRLQHSLHEVHKQYNNITGNENIEEIVGIAENAVLSEIHSLSTVGHNEPTLLGEGVDEYLANIEENPNALVGLDTGYPIYNGVIGGGLRRGTVNLIGARPGIGKSLFGLNVGLFVSQQKYPVLYLDTEMIKIDHWPRALSNLTSPFPDRATITEIETGEYLQNPRQKNTIAKSAQLLKSLPLQYLNVAGKPFQEIMSIARKWIHTSVGKDDNGNYNPCLIIYDYLKLTTASSLSQYMAEFQALGFMTSEMHNFAVQHQLPILAFIQLNRDGIDREQTDVIAQSDRILWLTTTFAIFKLKTPEEISMDTPVFGNRKLVVLKHRHGAGMSAGDYINFNFAGEYALLQEKCTHADAVKQNLDNAS